MNDLPAFDRSDFDQLVAAHLRLVDLTTELEYQLYRLGDTPVSEQDAACRQAAGALIGELRKALFRHDQQVLPVLESLLG
jgi:hypothetical protein